MEQKYKSIQTASDEKSKPLKEYIENLKINLIECQNPDGELIRLLHKYKESQTTLKSLSSEMNQKLSSIKGLESPETEEEEEEDFEKIKQDMLDALESGLRRIDAEEENAVAQLKMKYMTMRLASGDEMNI